MSVNKFLDPTICGGVGGSGTRVITQVLIESGFFMGKELNQSNDFLHMGKVLPELRGMLKKNGIKKSVATSLFVNEQLHEIQRIMNQDMKGENYVGWGWKVPPNFFLLEYLYDVFPDAKYIHVIRNGLDMAFSENENQLRNWGFYFGLDDAGLTREALLLKYWLAANRHAVLSGNKLFPKKFLLIKFEDLCFFPNETLDRIFKFLNISISNEKIDSIANFIVPPKSIGRFKSEDLSHFDDNDFELMNDFGYAV